MKLIRPDTNTEQPRGAAVQETDHATYRARIRNRNTTTDELNTIAGTPRMPVHVLAMLTDHPNRTTETMSILAGRSERLGPLLAVDPLTPAPVLRKYLSEGNQFPSRRDLAMFTNTFRNPNQVGQRTYLPTPRMTTESHVAFWTALLTHSHNLDDGLRLEAWRETPERVLRNTLTDTAPVPAYLFPVLETSIRNDQSLITDRHHYADFVIASNKTTPTSTLTLVMETLLAFMDEHSITVDGWWPEQSTFVKLARHPNTTPDMFSQLVTLGNKAVYTAAAKNPNCPEELRVMGALQLNAKR